MRLAGVARPAGRPRAARRERLDGVARAGIRLRSSFAAAGRRATMDFMGSWVRAAIVPAVMLAAAAGAAGLSAAGQAKQVPATASAAPAPSQTSDAPPFNTPLPPSHP